MFLLIPGQQLKEQDKIIAFKFHYVSINSMITANKLDVGVSLNSIMFLLIPREEALRNKTYHTLNSIMFLLIQGQQPCIARKISYFKFHYVSINSEL